MGTLLIEENQAHNIFATLHRAKWVATQLAEQRGIPASGAEEWLKAEQDLTRAVEELKTLIDQGAVVPATVNQICRKCGWGKATSTRIGRPRYSPDEKLDRIAELKQRMSEAKLPEEKVALGKKLRRIKRTLPLALQDD